MCITVSVLEKDVKHRSGLINYTWNENIAVNIECYVW